MGFKAEQARTYGIEDENVIVRVSLVGNAGMNGKRVSIGEGGSIPLKGGYASGTSSARRGMALVGERGPELVTMRGGERVHDATETARILGRSSGAGGSAAAPSMPNLSVIEQALASVIMKLASSGQLQITQRAVVP